MNGFFLLVLMGIRNYAYVAGQPNERALLWNIFGSITILVLVLQYAYANRIRGAWLAVVLWWAAEELMVIGCTSLYMLSPWHVPLGEDMCSSIIEFDIGKIGAAIMVLFTWLYVRSYRSQSDTGERK